ncbi:MAG: ribbon-helix-helix domain-containing protein [Rickettsiales bacterium]|jgi:predicted DNA-binding ribbon-helix-helix protein|nr:ribbon-helix-helix domain-containing protein [Rickettsiales bacterium]
MMKKISVSISKHLTSFSVEPEFIDELKFIAKTRKQTLASLVREIDDTRDAKQNLSSAIRTFVLKNKI